MQRASHALIFAGICALFCVHCGSSPPPGSNSRRSSSKAVASTDTRPAATVPSAVASAASVPAPLPSCELALTAEQEIEDSRISLQADWVLVVRKNGCVETWDIKQKKRMAVVPVDKAAHSNKYGMLVAVNAGVVVLGERKSAFELPGLQPTGLPKEIDEESDAPIVYKDGAWGIKNFDPKLAKALKKWIKYTTVTVHEEAGRTWFKAAEKDGIEHDVDISPDGKLFSYDARLVRLDTGAYRDFDAWTNSFTAMSGETFPGRVMISVGPRSDRAEIISTARMGAGPEIASAQLVDATTMKTLAPLSDACNSPVGTWSPGGKWIVREDCDHGVIANTVVVIDADTGKIRRNLPTRYNSYAADDNIVVSRGLVMNLKTGEVLLEVPQPVQTQSAEN